MSNSVPIVENYDAIAVERRRILAHAVCYRRAGKPYYAAPDDPCPCYASHPLGLRDGGGTLNCPNNKADPPPPDPLAVTREAYHRLCGGPFWLRSR